MQLMPQGDYYVWHCDWCNTRNSTLWIRVEQNRLCCSACHKQFAAFDSAVKLPTARFRLLQ